MLSLYGCGFDEFSRALSQHAKCMVSCDNACLSRSYSPELWPGVEMACKETYESGVGTIGADFKNVFRRGDSGFATLELTLRLKETGEVGKQRLVQEWRYKDGEWRLVRENAAGAPQR